MQNQLYLLAVSLLLLTAPQSKAQCPTEIKPLGKGNGIQLDWSNEVDRPSPEISSITFDDVSYPGFNQGKSSWRSSSKTTFDINGVHTVTYMRNGNLETCEYNNGAFEANALPVELEYFTYKNGELLWATAMELNNEHFIIEKATDGTNWIAIDTVKGFGTTQDRQFYQYTVTTGKAFYRLKQVDYDGTFAYSNMVSTDQTESSNKQAVETQVFPNPFTQQLQLLIKGGEAQVQVLSSTGNTVYSNVLSISTTIHTTKWLPGVYVVMINGESALFIKQ